MGVAVEGELTGHAFGEGCEYVGVFLGEVFEDEFTLCGGVEGCELLGVACEHVVEFGDEVFHRGDEFDEAFGDEDDTEVVAVLGAAGHGVGDVVYNVLEREVLGLYFFGDDADVGLGLEGTFEGDVACGAAHELDEVPVFFSGVAVALDVADYFGVDFGGGVEAE